MRTSLFVLALVASLGCESAEDECRAARETAHGAWGPVVDGALEANRPAQTARELAIAEVTRTTMDLGNARSEAAEEEFGTGDDAFVGIEVSIGAVIGAMLAADELWAVDAEAADGVVTTVNEELDERYAELMNSDLEAEGAGPRMIELGDACSTRLQLLVREQPERVRASVLTTFRGMEEAEGDPPEGIDFDQVKTAWASYVHAAHAARDAQALVDGAVAAREATSEASATAKEKADAVTGSADGLDAARQASQSSFDTCSAAGM